MAGSALFLTHTAPLPLASGERIRNYHLLRAAARAGWSVSLFSLVHGPAPSEEDEATLRELCQEVVLHPIDGSPGARRRRAMTAVLTRTAFHRHFFYTREAARRLQGVLDRQSFDAVVAELLYMYPYVPPELARRTVLDTHNAEARRVEAMASALGGSPRGLAARLQVGPVRRYEGQAARAAARVVAVSEADRSSLERLASRKVEVVPNGVDCEAISPRASLPSTPSLLFLASLDYFANADGAEYLVQQILPRVETREASVTIAGRGAPESLVSSARRSRVRVELPGFVESVTPLYEQSRVFVVPLRFGGGTRLKILEALAHGLPVVTTSAGCEGLELTHERELVIADEPGELAGWIDRLLVDDELAARLGAEGRKTVEAAYDWRPIGASFTRILDDVAAGTAS